MLLISIPISLRWKAPQKKSLISQFLGGSRLDRSRRHNDISLLQIIKGTTFLDENGSWEWYFLRGQHPLSNKQ